MVLFHNYHSLLPLISSTEARRDVSRDNNLHLNLRRSCTWGEEGQCLGLGQGDVSAGTCCRCHYGIHHFRIITFGAFYSVSLFLNSFRFHAFTIVIAMVTSPALSRM